MLVDNICYPALFLTLSTFVCCSPVLGTENASNLSVAESQPMTSSTSSTMISDETLQLSQKITTALGGSAFLLALVTYWLLIKYSTHLSSQIVLPSKFLAKNISALLSSAWPEEIAGQEINEVGTRKWELFHGQELPESGFCYYVRNSPGSHYLQVGYGDQFIQKEVDYTASSQPEALPLKIFSPVMKHLVQIALWNHVSFWMVLVIVANTLVYNGFLTENITHESYVRLSLVALYAAANIGHQWRCTMLLYENFSFSIF